MYPAGRRGTWRGEIPEADVSGRAAPDPRLCRLSGRVGAGFEPKSGHLVLLVADAQRDAGSGEGWRRGCSRAAVRGRPASRTPSVREQGHQAAAAVGGSGVVSSGRVFGSTQCFRELFKKIF
jgi:hypothetical protein